MSRVMVFHWDGSYITDLLVDVNRSWLLNEAGNGNFTIAIRDTKFSRQIIEYGNLVVVEHPKLPTWCGSIEPERRWSRDRVQVSLRSAEWILSMRRGPQALTITGTAGNIFEQIIGIANQQEDTLIRIAGVYGNLPARQETLNLTKLYDEIVRVAERSGDDWGVEALITPLGSLTLNGYWWDQRGEDRMLALIEGWNIEAEDQVLVEQGEIINDLMGYGEGATWESRETYPAIDDDSASTVRLRQGSKGFDGVTQTKTLQQNTEEQLAISAWPRKTFRLSALDKGETWKNIRLGDRLPLRMANVGFIGDQVGTETTVRILGMSYNEGKGKVDLVVDEVIA